jgi:UPF0755 protein
LEHRQETKDPQCKSRPFWRRLGWVVCFGTVGLMSAAFAWFFWSLPFGKPPFPRRVEIAPGAGLHTVSVELQRNGLIRNAMFFEALAILKGSHRRIQAGEYRFEAPASPGSILDRLTKGDVFLHQVTLLEGWTVNQVAGHLAEEGLIDEETFIQKAHDRQFIIEILGFDAPSLEGFLFPDTYRFQMGWGEERILRALVEHFNHAFDLELRRKTLGLGWSILEVVTLASLIEKETALPIERPLISGVFHKRLKLGMRLESDPSVIYGLSDFDGKLTKQDLTEPHVYNTYRIQGLPPGPICNPGRDALMAAVCPADEGYLYFVSKNDGSHQFSRTFREHVRAVRRYQRGGGTELYPSKAHSRRAEP